MRRKKLFYYVTSGSNVTRDVHWCLTVDYQQIANSNIANQIHGFTIDYGKFILKKFISSRVILHVQVVLKIDYENKKSSQRYLWAYGPRCSVNTQ